MGLDITAYKRLTKVENPQLDEDGDVFDWNTQWRTDGSMRWSEQHWPGRAEGVDFETVYTFEDSTGFRAGSYSGYNWWRQKLSEFAEGDAFRELIEFSDCEGVIGSVVSKKLAADFAEFENEAKEYAGKIETGEYWFKMYGIWKEAFEMAADGGAVNFR
ncbi:hypothetical protein MKZ12_07140 [Paenibacillus sp. FSL R5-0713]|uniref:hypothetical protein n=1 Tax=Paenibacillus sp. FSL R5-0713 TaxID=2921655 RepID=UPI0030D731FA